MRMLGLAVVVGLAAACGQPVNGGGSSASGSLGISRDDALLFAADPDLDAVLVVDARTERLLRQVKVGRQPEKLLVAPDDTVYVTNRLDRSVSVFRAEDAVEAGRIAVGVEPVGLAITEDGRTLYVVNAASLTSNEVGTLMAVDTRTLAVQWELDLGFEPRGIALLPGDRAIVTLYKSGDLVQVDLKARTLARSGSEVFKRLNASLLGLDTNTSAGNTRLPQPMDMGMGMNFSPATSHPLAFEAVLPSQDGKQLYVPSLLAGDQVLDTRSGADTGLSAGSGSSGYGGGSCGASSVAAAAVLTFGDDLAPQVDDLSRCAGQLLDKPVQGLVAANGGVIQGPVAMAMDPTGSFLFIANRESNNVAVIPTAQRPSTDPGANLAMGSAEKGFGGGAVETLVDVGASPTGVVVSHDGLTAWTFNAFDHSLTRIERRGAGLAARLASTLAGDVLPADVVAGRKLFFSARDARINSPTRGISCATCHLEGRDDGHVWNFVDGPRQTPVAVGRLVGLTAPYHWSGEFADLGSFMRHTVNERMGGSGLDAAAQRQVMAYLMSAPKPDNGPATTAAPEALARGRAAFDKAQCGTCHGGAAFTDDSFADVGTFVRTGAVRDDLQYLPHGLNAPSLLGVGRSAPYLHDGSAPTLKARLLTGRAESRHGLTGALDDQELGDLALYLSTL